MNSRSSVNESNLVNLSANLSTLDTLETKDSLSLSFPFDHIYACHSESSDRRQTGQTLSLDKDVEISTHCVVTDQKDLVVSTNSEISRLSEQLTAAESQNKKLKDLLIYHLDLIQQQNDVITKREKLCQALKQENDSLKSKVTRTDKKGPAHKHTVGIHIPPPVVYLPPPVPQPVVKTEPGTSQVMFNSFSDLFRDNRSDPYIFNEVTKPRPFTVTDPFDLNRNLETGVPSYLSDLGVSSILDDNIANENFTMIENKRTSSFLKKEIKTEPRPEPLYSVTTNSGNPVIQKIPRSRRRTSSSIGSLSRMPKTPPIKVEPPETQLKYMFEEEETFERNYSLNKKNNKMNKMINTYGKSKSSTTIPRTTHLTGSLCDRLQLIDTTPTGEDPYQLGEADMREQSPIPKLMLQKSNHSRVRNCHDTMGDNNNSGRIYDSPAPSSTTTSTPALAPAFDATPSISGIKLEDRYYLPSTITNADTKKEKIETCTSLQSLTSVQTYSTLQPCSPLQQSTTMSFEQDMHLPRTETEPDIDWQLNTNTRCQFGGDDSENSQPLPRLNPDEFQRLLETETSEEAKGAVDALENLDVKTLEACASAPESPVPEKTKKRGGRTTSLMSQSLLPGESGAKRGGDRKRGRKRALSTTGVPKPAKRAAKTPAASKAKPAKGKATGRGKKSPVPGMLSEDPYHTLVGDPDISWYYGLDPDVKLEDLVQPGPSTVSTVEVPRWREKPYTSCYTLEGTENLDDKVFEKRHQKLEAEERRQLRWHMRRIREQRHVERLRQRQRDSWCSGLTSPAYQQPSVYTIWPQPQRDVRVIEITDILPVMAFGENLPELPPADFMLPWVRTSKALKRSKRSKTLH